MLNIGPQELILVLIIALVVVGPSRLPELGRSLGRALRELRKVQDEVKDTLRFDLSDDVPGKPVTPRPRGTGGSSSGGESAAVADVTAPTPPGPVGSAPPSEADAQLGDAGDDGSAPEPSS